MASDVTRSELLKRRTMKGRIKLTESLGEGEEEGVAYVYGCAGCFRVVNKDDEYCRHCGQRLSGGDYEGIWEILKERCELVATR